jgi:hypothetical protein
MSSRFINTRFFSATRLLGFVAVPALLSALGGTPAHAQFYNQLLRRIAAVLEDAKIPYPREGGWERAFHEAEYYRAGVRTAEKDIEYLAGRRSFPNFDGPSNVIRKVEALARLGENGPEDQIARLIGDVLGTPVSPGHSIKTWYRGSHARWPGQTSGESTGMDLVQYAVGVERRAPDASQLVKYSEDAHEALDRARDHIIVEMVWNSSRRLGYVAKMVSDSNLPGLTKARLENAMVHQLSRQLKEYATYVRKVDNARKLLPARRVQAAAAGIEDGGNLRSMPSE